LRGRRIVWGVPAVRGLARAGTISFRALAVPIDALRALVPRELEIDTYDGRAWLSVVPLNDRRACDSRRPCRGCRRFRLNLRTYV
jgi:uncharacterized protein YqjF (DUF2071 family)